MEKGNGFTFWSGMLFSHFEMMDNVHMCILMQHCIAIDKSGYPQNIFLISP